MVDSERVDGGQREGGWWTARGWMVDRERVDGGQFEKWCDLLGLEKYVTVTDVRRLRTIERYGVHLSSCSNRVAAVAMYHRITKSEKL
jgi:hypothetical protein